MIVKCPHCPMYFDDEFRTTVCPHEAFSANDGRGHFKKKETAYLSEKEPRLQDLAPPD